jgi:hypothetical protein
LRSSFLRILIATASSWGGSNIGTRRVFRGIHGAFPQISHLTIARGLQQCVHMYSPLEPPPFPMRPLVHTEYRVLYMTAFVGDERQPIRHRMGLLGPSIIVPCCWVSCASIILQVQVSRIRRIRPLEHADSEARSPSNGRKEALAGEALNKDA